MCERFAEAVTMLARLPLTDAERVEAIRRLLAGAEQVVIPRDTAWPDDQGGHP